MKEHLTEQGYKELCKCNIKPECLEYDYSVDECANPCVILEYAFCWAPSPQGHDYWAAIFCNLHDD